MERNELILEYCWKEQTNTKEVISHTLSASENTKQKSEGKEKSDK
jgi:hypothetical protein